MKRIVAFLFIIGLLALAVWQGYQYFYRAPKDLSTEKAAVTLSTTQLIQAFESDSAKANQLYLGKIIAVEGNIKSVDEEDGVTIVLGEPASMSSVRCSMDTSHRKEWGSLEKGRKVVIKGNCTGFTSDELLGSDVILNRCVF
jgi:ABC-type phosphate transport system auxiliary subunit